MAFYQFSTKFKRSKLPRFTKRMDGGLEVKIGLGGEGEDEPGGDTHIDEHTDDVVGD